MFFWRAKLSKDTPHPYFLKWYRCPMKTQIIQLDNHDDIISARDKMAWSKAPRILLIWPQKGKLLERTVDLLILQRYAQSLGAQIGVVSGSLHIQDQARELGIPFFRNTTQAQLKSWRRPRGRRRLNLRLLDRQPAAAGLREQFIQLSTARNGIPETNWMRVTAFSLGVAAVFLLALLFWPSAQITLSPAQQEQELELDFRASPDIPAANASGGLPAYALTVEVEGSDQERSSGTVTVPATQARGRVEISNLGENELIIPAGTVVTSAGSKVVRYETTREVRAAAGVGSKVEVEILALIPGAEGNNASGTIRALEGTVGLLASVDNPSPIEGGSDQLSPGPTEDDYARLRERLITSLRETAKEDLGRNLGSGQRLLDGTITVVEVLSEAMSPPFGQPGDFARLTMRVEFTAWYVLEEDLQSVARAALEANRVEGFVSEANPVIIKFFDPPVIDEDGSVQWRALVKRGLQSAMDPERAARAVAGMPPKRASTVLENNYLLDEPARIQLFPRWWFRLPFLSFRIIVEIK